MTKLGAAIREWRGEESLRDFAKYIGTDNAYLFRVESGEKRPAPKTVAQWARRCSADPCEWVRLALQAQLDDAGLLMDVVKVEPIRRASR